MTRFNRPAALVAVMALVFAAFSVAGCSAASKDVVAKVNGSEISKTTIDKQIAQMKKASPATFESTQSATVEAQFRGQILESLIQLELIKQAAKDLGIKVSDKQIDDYVASLEKQYGGKKALETAMKQSGFDLAMLRDQISNNLLAEAVSKKVTDGDIKVTDGDIKKYYDDNKAQFQTPAQVNAQHILVGAKDEKLAKRLLDEIKDGAKFGELAKKNSTDPGTKDVDGNLGWSSPDKYVPEFAKALNEMKVNDLRLVKSTYGWHIIKLLGRKSASQQKLKDVSAQIRATLEQTQRSQSFGKYLADLEKKAKIEITDPAMKKQIQPTPAASK